MMKSLSVAGRYLFAASILAFGIQNIIFARSGSYLGPPWTPVSHLLAFFVGIALVIFGAALTSRRRARFAALVPCAILLARAAICYLPRIAVTPHNPDPWTNGFELLGIGGAGLILAARYPADSVTPQTGGGRIVIWLGRILFAVSLIVFAIQHFIYAEFVASLVPGWIPGHLFWAYFVGVAFIAAALAIVSGKRAQLAAALLGTMFLLWVPILHAPRVAAAIHNGDEWTSLFVALAMGGGSFIIAGAATE